MSKRDDSTAKPTEALYTLTNGYDDRDVRGWQGRHIYGVSVGVVHLAGRLWVCTPVLFLVLLGLAVPLPAVAQQAEPDQLTERVSISKSGYEEIPEFGGPSSVTAWIDDDSKDHEPFFRFDTLQRTLKPYFDFKDCLNKKWGMSFGLDYLALYQGVTHSLSEDQEANALLRFFDTWPLLAENPATQEAWFLKSNTATAWAQTSLRRTWASRPVTLG